MIWEGCTDVLLLLATYTAAQPFIIPMETETLDIGSGDMQYGSDEPMDDDRLENQREAEQRYKALMAPELTFRYFSYLSAKNLERVKDVCKQWEAVANEVLEKRGSSKIVYLPSFARLCKEDRELLHNFDNETVMYWWRPKLVLLFQQRYSCFRLCNEKWFFKLVRDLQLGNGKCFIAENKYLAEDLALCCGTPADCLTVGSEENSDISGCILPEALLKNFGADVIFPPLDMFGMESSLFRGERKANKELFANRFGWKPDVPIKLAFIFARETYGDEIPNFHPWTDGSTAKYRTEKVTSWLRSLPEGNEIAIFSIPMEERKRRQRRLPATGNDKDLAVLLFGGGKMLINYCIMNHMDRDDDDDDDHEEYARTERDVLIALRNNIRKWPRTAQKIVFALGSNNDYPVHAFWDVFRNDINVQEIVKLTSMGFGEQSNDYYGKTAFVIVGFPNDCKCRMGAEISERKI